MPAYIRIENLTRSSVVAERCRVARSFVERLIGLLRSPEPPPGEGLLILRTQSIHTWFMRYPIDLVFIDGEGRVTKTVPGLPPWRVVPWARGARDCLELRSGSIEGSGTRDGDVLRMAPLTQR